jgi:sodium-dependent phosphate transporter
MAVLEEYVWLVVVGAFVAFGFGFGTGSNDVANAFGTSVGSKTLTLRQAVLIASVFEFSGALLLGRVSTNTIAGGIADINAFTANPEVYAYGMVCALTVGTLWQVFSSYMGLNTSSTHTIIGAIIGFALVWDGKNAVVWAQKDPSGSTFPPYKGVVSIVMAWFAAPILTGATAALIFGLVRFLVLRRKNAYTMSFWCLPPMVLITVFINVYFVFTKGAKKALTSSKSSNWNDAKSAWISIVIAAGVSFLTAVIILPLLKRHCERLFDANGRPIAHIDGSKVDETDKIPGEGQYKGEGEHDAIDTLEPGQVVPARREAWHQKAWKGATHGVNVDIHKVVKTNAAVHAIHERAEVFEPRVEYAFSYLQVFSAICVIFAHGAGEVGYMAGPLAAIWDVYQHGKLNKNVSPPVWIVLIGAAGLVIGLATYGYNVTRAMGVQLAKLTPTRGFAAELATALVIMIAAQYGLPQSSSQCVTGAIVGVGLLEGTSGVNWREFAKQFASWVCTLGIVGLSVAALFAQGVYAPGAVESKHIQTYKMEVGTINSNMYKDFNATLQTYQAAALAGSIPTLSATDWAALNSTVAKNAKTVKTYIDVVKPIPVPVLNVTSSLKKTLQMYQNYTIFTLGQVQLFPGVAKCNSGDPASIAVGNFTATCKAPKLT